jgi:hypothetical protein
MFLKHAVWWRGDDADPGVERDARDGRLGRRVGQRLSRSGHHHRRIHMREGKISSNLNNDYYYCEVSLLHS